MEGELNNFILAWAITVTSLFFCHKIAKVTPPGTTRLCTFLPFIFVFLCLPLLLTTVNLSSMFAFFVSWLANFKLILFAFDKGPLFSDPHLPSSKFILMACLPIKIIENEKKSPKIEEVSRIKMTKSPQIEEVSRGVKKSPRIEEVSGEVTKSPQIEDVSREVKKSPRIEEVSRTEVTKSPWIYFVKFLGFLLIVKLYAYNESFDPVIKMALFCVHIYLALDLELAIVAYAARAMTGFELEPQFNEPYLATSLQDFWGRRWNLMVAGILRPTVYLPVRSFSGRFLPRELAAVLAVLASFLVSGLMHELIFYYMGRLRPTWVVTWFFVLHGVLLVGEVVVKRTVGGRFRLPAVVSGPAVLGLVAATSFWLFFPPFLRFDVEVRACKEFLAVFELVVRGRFVGPNDVSCPYF